MSKVKKEHLVPESYLKRFTYNGSQLFVFDKFTKRPFPANINDIAAESYFYDIPPEFVTGKVKQQITEEILSDIETSFSNVSHGIIEAIENNGSITANQKEAMSYFLTVQILRTRKFRNLLQVVLNEKMAKLKQADLMFNPANHNPITKKLKNHIWIIGINKTTQPFYTSDNPIVRRAHQTHPIRSYTGFGSHGIEVAFPLSSQFIILMFEKTYFEQFTDIDCKSIPLMADHIIEYNQLQVLQSNRQIYCMSNDFRVAEQLCQEQ
jgi:hypothetical protein